MFDGPDGYRVFCDAAAAAVRPRIPLWPSEWAERRRTLSPKSSSEPTKWRNARVPYLVTIMDALDVRHPAWLIVFQKSSQVGASECGLNWVGQTVDEDPVPMGVLFPGEALGRRWMRKRFEPMCELAPTLRAKIPPGRRSDVGNTLTEKDFPDGNLTVLTANVAVSMASDAYGKLLLDEVDRFPKEIGEEGDPVETVLRRMATYVGRRKAFLNSSPTIESLSHISGWWQDSSKGRYFVPCPHCGTKQVLYWQNVVYTPAKPVVDARYRCAECAALIDEHHKTEMLAAGEWQHEHPERCADIIGFHINCLYTPIGLGDTWNDNATAYERAKRDPGKLKAFINTRLGETNKDPTERLDWEVIHTRREPFALRVIPRGVVLLTVGVDVQKDRVEVLTLGWRRPGRATTIDYRIIEGDPTRGEVWDALDEHLAREYVSAGGVKMRVSVTLVDSGYLQEYVLTFTRARQSRNVFASKGSNQYGHVAIGQASFVDVKKTRSKRTRRDKHGAKQYQIGVSTLKEALYKRLQQDGGTDKAPILPEDRHYRFSDQLPEEWFRQLCAEVFDPHKMRWVKVYERNEVLDTMILAMAAALHHAVALDRMDDADWDRLEQMYEPAGRKTLPAPEQPQAKPQRPRSSSGDGGFGSPDWNI
ncbi:MAG: terminase gpA endonuclease subunit [Betaproteobacteria bacterium]